MNDESQRKTLALIGAGYWGKNLARNFNQLGVLHTICDRSPEILAGYREEYAGVRKTSDLQSIFDDSAITGVAIAAPAQQHFQLARDAIMAGKDVFVEKPLCLSASDAALLVTLAGERKVVLMVGHLLQYHPCIRAIKAMISRGELGKVQYITSNRLNLGKIRREENALWSFAPHDISVILSLAESQTPEHVRCVGGAYISEGVADTTLTTLKFAGGIRAHIYVSWLNPFKEQKITIVGSSGMIVFDDTKPWAEKLVVHRDYIVWAGGGTPQPSKAKGELIAIPESEPLRNECLHFLECCGNRSTPETDGNEGLRVLRVLNAAQESLDADGEKVLLSKNGADTVPLSSTEPQAFSAHATATLDDGCKIGSGTKIWHYSHIMKGAIIGENCSIGQNVNIDSGAVLGRNVKIQNNVSIYSGVTVEDDVFLGPSCVLTNVKNPRSQINRKKVYESTVIKRGATIGANATIVCGLVIGKYAFIGAGSVVTKSVENYALVFGNPAKQQGWMSRHGHILKDADRAGVLVCPESGLRYVLQESASCKEGQLKCIDIDEDSDLPAKEASSNRSYQSYKVK